MDPSAAGDSGASSGAAGGGGNPTQSQSVRKSPSFMNMQFLKGLSPSSRGNTPKETTEPPTQPKRRGPKPDSRPALTRRQELNRQAQRTHRERKEQYIRSLEVEISQLREGYSNDITQANTSIYQQRQALEEVKDENQALKQILTAHGIQFEAELERRKGTSQSTSHASPYTESNTQSMGFSGSGQPHTSTPGTSVSPGRSPMGHGSDPPERPRGGTTTLPYQGGPGGYQMEAGKPGGPAGSVGGGGELTTRHSHGVFEHDPQLGIDFILCLEDYCRNHIERLCRRAHDDEDQDQPAGHILMATCPPPSHIATAERGQPYDLRTYDLPYPNLDTLLNLSKQIVTRDEVTPIMALEVVKSHVSYHLLTREDVLHMMEELVGKVRCYGFGAVLEEFEFMDSLCRIMASKTEVHIDPTIPAPQPPTHPRATDDAMYS